SIAWQRASAALPIAVSTNLHLSSETRARISGSVDQRSAVFTEIPASAADALRLRPVAKPTANRSRRESQGVCDRHLKTLPPRAVRPGGRCAPRDNEHTARRPTPISTALAGGQSVVYP